MGISVESDSVSSRKDFGSSNFVFMTFINRMKKQAVAGYAVHTAVGISLKNKTPPPHIFNLYFYHGFTLNCFNYFKIPFMLSVIIWVKNVLNTYMNILELSFLYLQLSKLLVM